MQRKVERNFRSRNTRRPAVSGCPIKTKKILPILMLANATIRVCGTSILTASVDGNAFSWAAPVCAVAAVATVAIVPIVLAISFGAPKSILKIEGGMCGPLPLEIRGMTHQKETTPWHMVRTMVWKYMQGHGRFSVNDDVAPCTSSEAIARQRSFCSSRLRKFLAASLWAGPVGWYSLAATICYARHVPDMFDMGGKPVVLPDCLATLCLFAIAANMHVAPLACRGISCVAAYLLLWQPVGVCRCNVVCCGFILACIPIA